MSRKNYKTIDNGGTAFFVEVGKTVTVSKNMDTEEYVDGEWINMKNPRKPLFSVTPEKVFGGKGSVLLKLKTGYRFIGHIIYDFLPVKGDTIVSFHSKIGNSGVDYPYAIGKTHVYLFLGKVGKTTFCTYYAIDLLLFRSPSFSPVSTGFIHTIIT